MFLHLHWIVYVHFSSIVTPTSQWGEILMAGLNWSDENKNETPWTWTIKVDSALKDSDWKRKACQRIDKKIPAKHLKAFKHRLGLYNNK